MIDLTSMLINLSHSLLPVQSLLSGMGYLLGIMMIMTGVIKLKKVGDARGQSAGEGGLGTSLAFIGAGALLVYLPTSFSALSNTVFGATNILSYSAGDSDPFYGALKLLIQTAGLIWFVRGSFLLVHSSKPGDKEGSKGIPFLFAGICAMNFENSVAAISYALNSFFAAMSAIKSGTLWMIGVS